LYTCMNLKCKSCIYIFRVDEQLVVTAENEGEKFIDEFYMKVYIQNWFLNFSPSIL
jgi:hypothetical protein